MKPIVIVTSIGDRTPEKIAIDILGTSGNPIDNTETISLGQSTYLTYLCDLNTKYYENTISLLPYDGNVNELPEDILKVTEMLMIYFEPDDKSFKEELPSLCQLLIKHGIELGLLLTSKLLDDPKHGLTYESVKESCKFQFDVIELCNKDDQKNAGYIEIIEILKNNIWSDIKVPGKNPELSDAQMEEQLEDFENLITSMHNFKRISSNLERDEMLDEAEKLAELFIKMMSED
ncbi:uncharacterized protein [Eurosta solidaginis]|uniref:uncharacterized protein n=1 Tax=Eurosta solidaginis TaxID=178769 RepID=UPI00353118A9